MKIKYALVSFVLAVSGLISQAHSANSSPQQAFFKALHNMCGQAYAGKITVDNEPVPAFTDKPMTMYVMRCEADKVYIPFYVGDDASRTWIITKTSTGLSLQHDHRHQDGSADVLSMYGGTTLTEGTAQTQSFPADSYSKTLFKEQGIPVSANNVWHISVDASGFSYRMTRPGREFQVDFDLSQSIDTPVVPWGYESE